MTLKNALNQVEKRAFETSKKSDLKVYGELIRIITGLQQRNLSEAEIQSIEAKLDALDFNSSSTWNRKHLNKVLSQFKKYLKDNLSITTKGHYTNLGIALGSSFGLLLGIVLSPNFERSLGISMGLGLGMLIGLIIGRNMDAQAEVSGNMV